MASAADDAPITGARGSDSHCGGCTACCTVLAVRELRKPMRWACDHLACNGCRIYELRPQGCRDFDCLWFRGEIAGDESHRPDRLGVIFDSFRDAVTNEQRFVAFELWTGAFDEPCTAALISELAAAREVQLSYRDGSWRTIGAVLDRTSAGQVNSRVDIPSVSGAATTNSKSEMKALP